MPGGRKVFLCLWVICLVVGGSKAGEAADWSMTPSIETKAEYLNNIFYSPTFKKSDYILTAGPKLAFDYASEVTKLGGALQFSGLHYFQNSNLDRINQNYTLQGSTQATPRLGLNFSGSFVSTSNPTESLVTTGILTNRQLANDLSVSPGLSYNLTERWSTSLNYNFNLVNYQSTDFNNYEGHTITQGFDYLLNEKLTLLSRLTATYYKYVASNNIISSLGPQIGLTYKYMERWDMTFLGGLNYSRTKTNVGVLSADNPFGFVQVVQQAQTSSNVNPFISLGTNYRWETGGLSLNYVRNQSANAYGNQSQYNSFYLNVSQSINDRWTAELSPYIYTSTIPNPGSDYNSLYYGIRPGISYKLTEKATLSANYGFAYRTVTGFTNYSFPVNDVWLTLNYSYPVHYQH
jgi:hypothetical protein